MFCFVVFSNIASLIAVSYFNSTFLIEPNVGQFVSRDPPPSAERRVTSVPPIIKGVKVNHYIFLNQSITQLEKLC